MVFNSVAFSMYAWILLMNKKTYSLLGGADSLREKKALTYLFIYLLIKKTSIEYSKVGTSQNKPHKTVTQILGHTKREN